MGRGQERGMGGRERVVVESSRPISRLYSLIGGRGWKSSPKEPPMVAAALRILQQPFHCHGNSNSGAAGSIGIGYELLV